MMTSSYQICDLFKNSETQLGKLITQVRALSALNELFSQYIDPDLVDQCRVGGYGQGVLTLIVENASVATRLRYQTANMLTKLRQDPKWAGLASIQIKVRMLTI